MLYTALQGQLISTLCKGQMFVEALESRFSRLTHSSFAKGSCVESKLLGLDCLRSFSNSLTVVHSFLSEGLKVSSQIPFWGRLKALMLRSSASQRSTRGRALEAVGRVTS